MTRRLLHHFLPSIAPGRASIKVSRVPVADSIGTNALEGKHGGATTV